MRCRSDLCVCVLLCYFHIFNAAGRCWFTILIGNMTQAGRQQSFPSRAPLVRACSLKSAPASVFPGAAEWNHAGWGDLVCVGMKAERDADQAAAFAGVTAWQQLKFIMHLWFFLWVLWSFITNVVIIFAVFFCGWLSQMFVFSFHQLRIYDLILLCGINFNKTVWYCCWCQIRVSRCIYSNAQMWSLYFCLIVFWLNVIQW